MLLRILEDVIQVLCSFDVILGSPVFSADVRNSLVDGVEVILSSGGVVINVVVLLIWICFVAMGLSDFKENLFFNCLVMIIWVKKHVLVISSRVEKVINVFLLRFNENGLFLNQILRILMLEKWTKVRVSIVISLLERNVTVFIFFCINFIILITEPKLNFFILEHLLLVVSNVTFDWANNVAV